MNLSPQPSKWASHRVTITSSPNTSPAILAGTPKFVPAPLELEAAGLTLVEVVESSATMREGIPSIGKPAFKSLPERIAELLRIIQNG